MYFTRILTVYQISLSKDKLEKLIKQKVGKGQRVAGSLYEPTYIERVNFNEVIGEYALEKNGEIIYKPTTKAVIKYSKEGVHIIPSDPEAILITD